MIHDMKAAIAIGAISLLTACAGPVPKIDSAPATLAQINDIAVIGPPEPRTYTVMNLGHPGMAFGLIGGLIAAGDMSAKQDQITGVFRQHGAAFSSNLAREAAGGLARSGYAVRVEEAPWVETDGKFQLTFDKIQSKADAVLVIAPTIVGFIATGPAADYLPTITAIVTLLGKDRKEILYRGFHAYGWQLKAEGWKLTPARRTFSNFDTLMADPKASADSLNEAGSAIAASITADLRREGSERLTPGAPAAPGAPTTLDDLKNLLPPDPPR